MNEKTLVFDIETTGLNAIESKITCICCEDLNEDYQCSFINDNEEDIIKNFTDFIKRNNYKWLVSANGKDFDLPFILLRSYLLEISLINVRHLLFINHFDVVNDITNKKISLNNLAKIYKLGEKTGDGKNAIELYNRGMYEELSDYCLNDVHLTKLVYKKYMYMK